MYFVCLLNDEDDVCSSVEYDDLPTAKREAQASLRDPEYVNNDVTGRAVKIQIRNEQGVTVWVRRV